VLPLVQESWQSRELLHVEVQPPERSSGDSFVHQPHRAPAGSDSDT